MNKSLICIRSAHSINKTITNKGFKQINNLNINWKNKKDIELVLTDIDNVSLNTSKHIFKNKPIIQLENNTIELHSFFDLLKKRKECMIAYVGNNDNINKIKYVDPMYNKNDLYHCYPYLMELSFLDYCNN